MIVRTTLFALAVSLASSFGAAAQGTPDFAAIVAAPDRSDADRATDKRRDPVQLMTFTGVRTGMTVLDMGAGGGYSTELVARAVGPTGKVYGQNAPMFANAVKALEARTMTPGGKNIVAVARPFDDPLPPEVGNLDMITYFFFYHDTGYLDVNRAQMNKKLFDALKPGGVMIIADHSAKAGTGLTVARSLHRIEESVLKREVEAAGFKLVGDGGFLRHPEDPRDFSVQPVTPTRPAVDEFVLKFQKPQ